MSGPISTRAGATAKMPRKKEADATPWVSKAALPENVYEAAHP